MKFIDHRDGKMRYLNEGNVYELCVVTGKCTKVNIDKYIICVIDSLFLTKDGDLYHVDDRAQRLIMQKVVVIDHGVCVTINDEVFRIESCGAYVDVKFIGKNVGSIWSHGDFCVDKFGDMIGGGITDIKNVLEYNNTILATCKNKYVMLDFLTTQTYEMKRNDNKYGKIISYAHFSNHLFAITDKKNAIIAQLKDKDITIQYCLSGFANTKIELFGDRVLVLNVKNEIIDLMTYNVIAQNVLYFNSYGYITPNMFSTTDVGMYFVNYVTGTKYPTRKIYKHHLLTTSGALVRLSDDKVVIDDILIIKGIIYESTNVVVAQISNGEIVVISGEYKQKICGTCV